MYVKYVVIRKSSINVNYYYYHLLPRFQKCFFVLSISKNIFGKTVLKVFIYCLHSQGDWMGNKWSKWSHFAQITSSNPVPVFWNKHIPFHSLLSYNELFPRETFHIHANRAQRGTPQWTSRHLWILVWT